MLRRIGVPGFHGSDTSGESVRFAWGVALSEERVPVCCPEACAGLGSSCRFAMVRAVEAVLRMYSDWN